MPKVKVNPELCGSCGLCVGARPEVFEFDEDGHAKAVAECEGELGFECPFGAIDEEYLIFTNKKTPFGCLF